MKIRPSLFRFFIAVEKKYGHEEDLRKRRFFFMSARVELNRFHYILPAIFRLLCKKKAS